MIHVLYFNGLGYGKTRKREQLAFNYLAKRGVKVVHAPINWYAGESFDDIFDRMLNLTEQQLKEHGKLVLVGSSAGGSVAINITGKLKDPNLYAVSLCSRLNERPIPWWDVRSLQRMARLDSEVPCQAFNDSVMYCTDTTIPKLTKQDKANIITVQQWMDFVVPRATMTIPGVEAYKVPGLGHGWGIAVGTRQLPIIVKAFKIVTA
jgi:hypothetical protein